MIYFTAEEIYLSILYAVIYGAAFAILYCFLLFCIGQVEILKYIPKAVKEYDKIFSLPKGLSYMHSGVSIDCGSGVFIFFAILLFSLGFILLSYFALDGDIRIYMITISVAAFFAFKSFLSATVAVLLQRLFCMILSILIYILRIISVPFVSIYSRNKQKNAKYYKNLPK